LERIAEKGEPGSVSALARCLFSASEDVRKSVCQAIHRLLAPLPPDDLLHLSEVIRWSWDWDVSDAWDKLQPAEVPSLAADPSCRSTLLGLISFHRNGYVRHEAVRLLAASCDGSELPFLLIRQNDWVEPIGLDAREAVRRRLNEKNLPALLVCLPLVLHLLKFSRRDHSSVVQRVIDILLRSDNDASLAEVLKFSDRDVRRKVCRMALNLDGPHQPRVVIHGLSSDDGVVRYWCACKLRQCLPLEANADMVRRLQQDHYMPVRREGLLLEAEVRTEGSQGVWQRAMLDLNPSIRDLARYELQKTTDFNAAAFYRNWLGANGPSLTAISGLGETGDSSDLSTLRGFLKSRLPSWRRAAVRGLAALGKEHAVSDLVGCLRDQSPAVVRETGRRLQPLLNSVPGDMLLTVVNDGESEHAKRTALRLLFEKGKWDSLPWLIRAADHPDDTIAKNAQSYIEAWFSPSLCNRVFTRPSQAENKAIEEALAAKKVSLPKQFLNKLTAWLGDRWQ
jgi:HEAT repeat protein